MSPALPVVSVSPVFPESARDAFDEDRGSAMKKPSWRKRAPIREQAASLGGISGGGVVGLVLQHLAYGERALTRRSARSGPGIRPRCEAVEGEGW